MIFVFHPPTAADVHGEGIQKLAFVELHHPQRARTGGHLRGMAGCTTVTHYTLHITQETNESLELLSNATIKTR